MVKPATIQHRYSAILTGYTARRFTLYLVLTLAVLAAFIYLIDLIDLFSRASNKGLPTLLLMQMSLMKLPNLMQQLLPFAVLLATMVTLNQLNRASELVALRASGMPARRIMLGPLLVVLLAGVMALTILNPLAAAMLKRYERWEAEIFPGSAQGLVTAGGNIWLKQNNGNQQIFIYGRKVSKSGQILENATVFVFSPQGDFTQRVDAATMQLLPGQWQLTNSMIMSLAGRIEHEDNLVLPTTLTPQMIQSSFTPPATLSVWELGNFIDVLRQTGFPSSAHEMAYQRILAMPGLLIAMFLLGVPFALTFVRGRNLATAIGAGLGMGFGFYTFANLMATFGLAGRLDVSAAAWAPTAIAILLAFTLLLHFREE